MTLTQPDFGRELGRLEQLAWDRNARDLELAGGPGRDTDHPKGFWYDPEDAGHVVQFFEGFLRHYKGEWAGQPFELEPWQEYGIIRPLFGWKRRDGTRRFRTAYIELPRKNGKTIMAAGFGVYLTFADGEMGSEVYSYATKKDQAKIAWSDAKEMIERSPALKENFTIRRNTLSVPEFAAKFEPLGADADTLDGLNPHGAVVDEVHAHKSRDGYDKLKTGMGSRREPLVVMITTAGIFDPEGFGWGEHDYARKVLEGVFEPQDESYFAYIAAADEEDDWTDPETWAKANPNFKVSVKKDFLQEEAGKAKRQPSYVNTFLRFHLNRWVEQKDRWIGMADWDDCGGEVNEEALEGRMCFAGLDLSAVKDLTAFVAAFPPVEEGERWKLVSRFWCPVDTIWERSEEDRVPYDAWHRDGWLYGTKGKVIDYDEMRGDILRFAGRFDVCEVGFDPWNATQLALQLEEEGLEMVKMRQGTRTMGEPSKEFERLVVDGRINHGDNPVLRWMAANVVKYEDRNGNIKPDKGNSQDRIDGITSSVMAIGRATVGDWEPGTSKYEEEDLLVLG